MTHQELTRTTPWVNPGKGKQPGWLAGGLAVAVAGTAIAATLELRHPVLDPGGDPGGVRQQTLRSISVTVPSDAKVQNHSVGPPIWDSCDGAVPTPRGGAMSSTPTSSPAPAPPQRLSRAVATN